VKRRKAEPFHSTTEFTSFIEENLGRGPKGKHRAAPIFQALRMAVNQEPQHLAAFLEILPHMLLPGAWVAIITFHSGEDRMVKQAFRQAAAGCLCPSRQPVCTCNHTPTLQLAGKPISPTNEEIQRNPQARSAKLRVAVRL
jgi:16S rRNA (cytosine1402-N4)-methyltransferase